MGRSILISYFHTTTQRLDFEKRCVVVASCENNTLKNLCERPLCALFLCCSKKSVNKLALKNIKN